MTPVARLGTAARAAVRLAAVVLARGLAAVRITTDRAAGTAGTLQALPDSTLLGLAAASVGVSTGFYLARQPRLAVAIGVAPALLAGAAIILRPIDPVRDAVPIGQ